MHFTFSEGVENNHKLINRTKMMNQLLSKRLLLSRCLPTAARLLTSSSRFGYYTPSTNYGHLPFSEHHGTTILNVRKKNKVVMIGDGQISLGHTVFKTNAKKLRKIQDNVVCGFAGSAADCLALLELLEKEFEKHPG